MGVARRKLSRLLGIAAHALPTSFLSIYTTFDLWYPSKCPNSYNDTAPPTTYHNFLYSKHAGKVSRFFLELVDPESCVQDTVDA